MNQKFTFTIELMSEEEEAEFNRQVEAERERGVRERAEKKAERARKTAELKGKKGSPKQLGFDF
jgi:hypothetical protein